MIFVNKIKPFYLCFIFSTIIIILIKENPGLELIFLIVGIAVFVILILIICLVIYTLYFLHKTDKHNRKLYKYIENDFGEHVLFVVPKKEIMSHVTDYSEVEKEIKRKKTLEKIFLNENKINPMPDIDMPNEDELTPHTRNADNANYYDQSQQANYMPGIREQEDTDEFAYGDGQDPFINNILYTPNQSQPLNGQGAFGNSDKSRNMFNFDNSEQNRKLLSHNSSMSAHSKNWSIGTLPGSNRNSKGTTIFDTPKLELPSESNEARSFRIPDYKFEDYFFNDKKHKRYSNLF